MISINYLQKIILTLKILGGLSIKEIARELLKKEETIAKSYTRAKKKFQQEKIQLELSGQSEINNRLKTVLHIIYLLFNE
jgi:predicted RNA polymerase sigma factor